MERPYDDDDVDVLPVPLDRETRRWLAETARATGAHPRQIAASILKDVRIDTEHAERRLH